MGKSHEPYVQIYIYICKENHLSKQLMYLNRIQEKGTNSLSCSRQDSLEPKAKVPALAISYYRREGV